jgi:hypothetical protein
VTRLAGTRPGSRFRWRRLGGILISTTVAAETRRWFAAAETSMGKALAFAIALAGAGLMAGSVAVFGVRAPANPSAVEPVWTEVKWPFLLDQWGIGKAFTCLPADCGVKVDVYIRPKIGFCNCSTGVSDDTELERVADTELVSPNTKPAGASRPVKIGWMNGLARRYRVSDGEASQTLLSVAFNDECDVVVAVAALGDRDPAVIEPAVIAFLKSTPMVLWAKKELGLEYARRDW